jgi:hypothetical protein
MSTAPSTTVLYEPSDCQATEDILSTRFYYKTYAKALGRRAGARRLVDAGVETEHHARVYDPVRSPDNFTEFYADHYLSRHIFDRLQDPRFYNVAL